MLFEPPPSPGLSLTCPFLRRKIHASDPANHPALPHHRETRWRRDGRGLQGRGLPQALFPPSDLVVFKVESDFFQVQTPYAQQAIEVASIISLVCHHEACQWAELFLP